MSNLINRKKEKAYAIFELLGMELNEETFIETFKQNHPKDWLLVRETFESEEQNTKPGKRHPMPHPDQYMKNMYRNLKKRWEKEH